MTPGDQAPGRLRDRDNAGGKRPDDPTDTFDYGLGGIVKSFVFFVSGLAIVWEIINSPFFERAAEPSSRPSSRGVVLLTPVDGVDR